MNKNEFIKKIQDVGEYKDRKEAERAFNSVIDSITDALANDESVELTSFGKFTNVLQKGKKGKVPNKDEMYETEDKYIPKFRPGKNLKDVVLKIKK